MKSKQKLLVIILVIVGISAGYLVLAKYYSLWPLGSPNKSLLELEKRLEEKYGQDYKPIYIYVKTGTPEGGVRLLKEALERFTEVVAVEIVSRPDKPELEYIATLRLVPMVKKDPQGLAEYPSNVLEFLEEHKTDPSSPTKIINSWSLQGEEIDFFDFP